MKILYFFIALFATTIGSTTGMGGGVIIKPVLDALAHYDVATIGVLSALAVFAMSIVSVGKQILNKNKIDIRIAVILSIGSIVGGTLGNKIFNIVILHFNKAIVKIIQNSILAGLIFIIFFYMIYKDRIKSYTINHSVPVFLSGIFLGMVSSFLGIGGGPINVALFTFLYSYNTKMASLASLITILFSQISKLVTIWLNEGFLFYDLSVSPYMIVGAVIGGYIGAEVNRRVDDNLATVLFNAAQVLIFAICIFNIYQTAQIL